MLDSLSTELVERLASFLNSRHDLGSLRLVCRRLHNTTLAAVASAWFGTVETDLCPRSIRRLEAISRNETFRLAVRKVRTGGRCPSRSWLGDGWPRLESGTLDLSSQAIGRSVDTGPGCQDGPECLGSGYTWPRLESGALDLSSRAVQEVQAIITRFVGVTAIEVNDELGSRPEELGTGTSLSPTDALNLFLSTLGFAQDTIRLRSFHVKFKRHSAYLNASQLPASTVNSTALRTAWSHLELLDISWQIGGTTVERALALISAATSLKTLCLSLSSEATDEFLIRLAGEAAVPPISHLRLCHMVMESSAALADAVTRFRASLRSLHIAHVGFLRGNWNDFFERIAQQQFPLLERVTAFQLRARQSAFFCPLRMRQAALRSCGGVFEFTTARVLHKWRVIGVRYSGPPAGTELALKALGEESSYVLALRTRTTSPGLPDMMTYTGDTVGRLVDLQQFWLSTERLSFP